MQDCLKHSEFDVVNPLCCQSTNMSGIAFVWITFMEDMRWGFGFACGEFNKREWVRNREREREKEREKGKEIKLITFLVNGEKLRKWLVDRNEQSCGQISRVSCVGWLRYNDMDMMQVWHRHDTDDEFSERLMIKIQVCVFSGGWRSGTIHHPSGR